MFSGITEAIAWFEMINLVLAKYFQKDIGKIELHTIWCNFILIYFHYQH